MDRIREWETASQKAYAVSNMLPWVLRVLWNKSMKMEFKKFHKKYLQIKGQVQVRKVDDEGELPGLMIEEMMESASVV